MKKSLLLPGKRPYTLHFTMFLLLVAVLATGCKKETFDPRDSLHPVDQEYDAFGTATKPNILFIVGDDIGYEILTCNGGQSYSTPNIDKIARNGIRFTQAHASPLCTPSRVTLLTGKYNFRNYEAWGYLRPNQKTIGNMFANNGYATAYAGKWQLDGGAESAAAFGWQKYSLWLPFLFIDERLEGSRYKSPKVFQDGAYLPDTATKDKYSDDIFTSYIMHFMDSVSKTGQPFFVYYSMILGHQPFSPTPDDPEFATWNFEGFQADGRFYPSMIRYMDKKIGELLMFLNNKRLLKNTVIIFAGDNGSPSNVRSLYNGFEVQGGKKTTYETGTNIPLLVAGLNRFVKNKKSNVLTDFTDILPSLADIAGIPRPQDFGILDGVSFYPVLINGDSSALRTTIYNTFAIQPIKYNAPWNRWVQNDRYKLYDTNKTRTSYQLMKIEKCKPDPAPITNPTPEELALQEAFIAILRSYVP